MMTAAEYIIIIGHSSESTAMEIANANNLFHKRVDGLIVSLAYDTVDLGHYDPFIKRGIPIVFFDRVRKDAPGIKVIIDNVKAGYDAKHRSNKMAIEFMNNDPGRIGLLLSKPARKIVFPVTHRFRQLTHFSFCFFINSRIIVQCPANSGNGKVEALCQVVYGQFFFTGHRSFVSGTVL